MTRSLYGMIVILLGSTACSKPSEPAQDTSRKVATTSPSEYPVTLMFDGGYVLMSDYDKKTLTVADFDGGHHSSGQRMPTTAPHRMRLRLDMGTVVAAPSSLKLSLDVPPTWNLDESKYDIAVASYGETPAGVIEPPSMEPGSKDPCDSSASPNNLALLPAMEVLAAKGDFDGTVMTDRKNYENQVVLTSGTMTVSELTSCMEFKTGGKTVKKHRVPNGLGGIHVDFKMKGNLNLSLKDQQGRLTEMEFAPEKNALGKLTMKLWFGRFPPPCGPKDPGCYYGKGEEVSDFARFYSVLKSPPTAAKRVMPFIAADRNEVCPGSQCPSVRVVLNKK